VLGIKREYFTIEYEKLVDKVSINFKLKYVAPISCIIIICEEHVEDSNGGRLERVPLMHSLCFFCMYLIKEIPQKSINEVYHIMIYPYKSPSRMKKTIQLNPYQ
jgi:hypothetical protein